MACKKCDYKGYIIDGAIRDDDIKGVARVCPHCNDLKAYSDYIKGLYGSPLREVKPVKAEILCTVDNIIKVRFSDDTTIL